MKITIEELARLCGVSTGTVDRALNDRPGINAETKRRIQEVAERVAYRPHLIARSLASGRSKAVGVVLLNLDNSFFSQLVSTIERVALDHGYFTNVTLSHNDVEREKSCLERLSGYGVDGIIMFPVNKGREYEQYLRSLDTPIVAVGNRLSGRWSSVTIGNREALFDAVKLAASRGYGRVAYVAAPFPHGKVMNDDQGDERYRGFRAGVAENTEIVESTVIKGLDYLDKCASLVKDGGGRWALLCNADLAALELLEHFRSIGISVPRDVGLTGFDDLSLLRYTHPGLTTIAYPIREMSRKAFASVMTAIENPDSAPVDTVLPHVMVERETL